MAEFRHTPLRDPKREIRLIVLEIPNESEILSCKLVLDKMHVSSQIDTQGYTASPESYHALSYAWGDSKPTIPIRIDGKIFKVCDNLHVALQRLQGSKSLANSGNSRHGGFRLWVDAICIDQSNVSERNEQVQRMHFIYSNAASVIIWLGKDHEYEDDTSKFSASTWGQGLDSSKWVFAEHTMNAMDLVRRLCILKTSGLRLHAEILNDWIRDTKCWAHLSLLFKRTWFERLWICQELYVSQMAYVYIVVSLSLGSALKMQHH
jgi:hypothetical protein